MIAALGLLARHGRMVLVAGIVCGVAFPSLAAALKGWIPPMAAALLYLAALRVAPDRATLAPRALGAATAATLLHQLALPCALAAGVASLGWGGPLAAAVILMAAGPAVVGAPAITALAGGDPAPALRVLIVGTAILPLTAPPVFWLAPGLGEAGAVARAALRLTAVIAGAVALAALTRRLIPEARRAAALRAADGLTVLALAVLVVGLMAAVGPALRAPDAAGMAALGAAFAANLGLQALAWVGYGAAGVREGRVALSVTAGNRNMALFLIALPPETTDPLLGFIGFYQIPMFLTPILLGALAAQPLSRRM